MPLCLYFVLSNRLVTNWQPYAYSMFLICFILAQGVYYWHLKLREVKKIAELPPNFFKTFTTLKILNFILILLFPILAILGKAITEFQFQISIWSVLLSIFAILEFINYYYFQLSHDSKNDIQYLIQHKIRNSIESDGESLVSDLHVWTIGPNIYAAQISIVSSGTVSPAEYKARIPEGLGLNHISIEVQPRDEIA